MIQTHLDPFGPTAPAVIRYVSGYAGQIDTVTVMITMSAPRDYATELLDRVRYLKDVYVTPYEPGGVVPSAQAFADAESFILKLPLNRTGMPKIDVASDGEVNFCWFSDNSRVDLGFFGNGTYSYFGQAPGSEVAGENVAATSEVSPDLVKIAASST